MSYFIFQGNPDKFDIDAYIAQQEEARWTVRQRRKDIHVGDNVFIWRAAGSGEAEAGVVAVAEVLTEPRMISEDAASLSLWHDGKNHTEALRVDLRLLKKCLGPRETVQRKWLLEDPICKDMTILKNGQGTNFLITQEQGQRLFALCANTGRDWTYEECVAGLWAYNETEGKEVSKLAGSPVASVALTIGRAVSGVYNKAMNFRHLDPRDARKGFSGNNRIDKQVWSDFFDQTRKELDAEALDKAFRGYWGATDIAAGDLSLDKSIQQDIQAEEVEDTGAKSKEGAPKPYYGKRYERDPVNRRNAIKIHGLACKVCGFHFGKVYGSRGTDFIEVHHRKPICTFGDEAQMVDPRTDLVPLCANCHRMIHRRPNDVLTVEQLQELYGLGSAMTTRGSG